MKNLNELRKRDPEVIPFERKEVMPQEKTRALLSERSREELRQRWTSIQSSFVDEPRKAVEEADHLVASVIKQIEDALMAERATMEKQWSHGEEVSTEDLRVFVQRYRDFFERIMSQL